MPEPGPFQLETEVFGPLPVINHFLRRLRLSQLLASYVPQEDARLRLAPASVLGIVVRNLVLHREPVYALGEWAAPFAPWLLGLARGEQALLNDDRVGRCLERLFDADRASLLTELVLGAVATFDIDVRQLHNDSTTVSFSGTYAGATGRTRGGTPTPAIAFGHNKDHRPDLKQLLWILTVSADGAVPIAYRTADGNSNDDPTHIPTWDGLVRMLGTQDFLYVADCKLASREAMDHISRRGGRFVTVLPRSRREDESFRTWIQTHLPEWTEVGGRPARRLDQPDDVWRATPAHAPSAEGYRIVWVHSSAKECRDAAARQERIERGRATLEELAVRVHGARSRLSSRVAIETAAEKVLESAGCARWIAIEVTGTVEERFRQERRGRPGSATRYRKLTTERFQLTWQVRADVVAADAASDGCYPLITNDTTLTMAELVAAYKYQPHLERRHAQLKGVQLVAPVFLKDVVRIEALLGCHFVALLVQALIEREIRGAMTETDERELPVYPEGRACKAPSAARVLEIFQGISRHRLMDGDRLVQLFEPSLTPLQHRVLDLLGVPAADYASPMEDI